MKKMLLLLGFMGCGFMLMAQNDLGTRLITQTQNFIEQKIKSDGIVGVSAALIVDDSIIWEKGFGFADLENQVPMTQNTIVHIGSVTKPVTAMCAMQLQEQGLLDINQPVNKYLPQFNPKNQLGRNSDITVKNLITHSSGLQPDIWKNSDLNSGKYTDVVEFINETHVMYPPGSLGMYANSGYNILGHIIKEVSGMDYADYVHEHIFKPLGMIHSGFFMDSLRNTTKIYDRNSKPVIEYPLRDIASGGIYCDVHDFALLAKGVINSYHGQSPHILKSPSMKEVFSIQNGEADFVTGKNKRGLGWYLFENGKGLAVNHTGSAGFAFAHLMIFPKDKAALMMLTNCPQGRPLAENAGYNLLEEFGLEIADVFTQALLDEEKEPEDVPVKLSKRELKKYVGNYAEAISYSTVFLEDDSLKIKRNGQKLSLLPQTSTSFKSIYGKGKEIKDTQYFFKDIGDFPCLVMKKNNAERVLGYKFRSIRRKKWENKTGSYEHFGYQLLAGEAKFESIELKITEDDVLVAILKSKDNAEYSMPIDVISKQYGKTAGLMSGYGWTLTFSEDKDYYVVDFAGITFRKKK